MSPTPDEIAAAVQAERERIAKWHERQADLLEHALEQITREGGTVELSKKSLAQLHREFAAAIRAGAE